MQATEDIDPAVATDFCYSMLSTSTLISLGQLTFNHECYLKYDLTTKRSTLTIKLNPLWTIPVDVNKSPTIQITMNTNSISTPECDKALDLTQFENIALTGGDTSNPVVIIARTVYNVPVCTDSLRISSGLSSGLFGRPATFFWSMVSMTPTDVTNTKQTKLLAFLNADAD